MTEAIGRELGAEIEAGGRTGLAQSPMAARHGKGLSANWFKGASGDLPTGMASGAPSFHSSWQSVMNAWRGVSNETSGIETKIETKAVGESGTTVAMKAAEEDLAAKNGQTTISTARASSSGASESTATSQNVLMRAAVQQNDVPLPTTRSAWRAARNVDAQAPPTASADATPTERAGAAKRDHTDAAVQRDNQENTRQVQATEDNVQALAPAVEAPIVLPASPASSGASPQAETAATTPLFSRTVVLPDVSIIPAPGRAEPHSLDVRSIATAGNFTAGTVYSAAPAGLTTRTMHTAPASILRGKTQANLAHSAPAPIVADKRQSDLAHAAPASNVRSRTQDNLSHEAAASSLDDTSESTASPRMNAVSSSEIAAAEAKRELSSARVAAIDKSLSAQPVQASTADDLTNPGLAVSATHSPTPLAASSATVHISADAVQDGSQTVRGPTSRATSHSAVGQTVATATPVDPAQTAAVDTASVALRTSTPTAQASAAPASVHTQIPVPTSAAAPRQDTISALDAGTSLGTPTWTHAGGQHAEAGFRDPALGWVGVRADLSAGGIHATVVPNSEEAAQALNGHLAGLSAHLVQQQTPVVSLSMASPSESGVENGMGQRMQQGAQGSPQGGASDEPQASSQDNAPPAPTSSNPAASAQSSVLDTLTYTGELRGTRISVMA